MTSFGLWVHWAQLGSFYLRTLMWLRQIAAGAESPEGLSRWDIQDGSLTQLAVDAGCQLRAQLRLVTTGKHMTSPCNQSFSRHAIWVPTDNITRASIPRNPGDREAVEILT